MKILVCGGAGFIGTYVVEELAKQRHEVTVADNLSKKESHFPLSKGVHAVNIDLTDPDKTFGIMEGMDACLNLASKIGGIGYFHKLPATILSENNKLYSSIFESAAKAKIKRIIYVSSSMVFESSDRFPNKEADLRYIPPPESGYGFSKLVGESYCRTFKQEHNLDYTIIRPFNAYGINESPGDYVGYSHVIPDLGKKILLGQHPLEILGDGSQTRCFTHVRDLANGIVMCIDNPSAVNEDFNLGTDEETAILDLARMMWEIAGRKEEFMTRSVPGFTHDIKRRVPDYSKAKEILGWRPMVPLDEGLKEYLNWLKKELKI
jgi:UDP-glucose 4-epimerase